MEGIERVWAKEWRWSACCSGRSMLRPYEESRRRGVGRKSALCPVEGRRVPHMDVWLGDGDVWMREALWRQWVDAGRTGTRSALRWCEGGVTAHVKGPRSKDLGYINGRVKRAGGMAFATRLRVNRRYDNVLQRPQV